MKKTILTSILMLFFFGSPTLHADPIEGNWKISESNMNNIMSSLPQNSKAMFGFVLSSIEDMTFYKGGKFVYTKASMTGSWRKSGSNYQLITNTDKLQAHLSRNMLKVIPPKSFPFKQAIVYKRISKASNKMNHNIKPMIRYDRKYFRTTKNRNGSQSHLIIRSKDKTCSLVTIDADNSGRSSSSSECSILNGQLFMGPFMGKAQILSPSKIKFDNHFYVLNQHSSQNPQKPQTVDRRMVGMWKNIDKNTASIRDIEVLKKGTQYKVQVFGACQPKSCYWGERNAQILGKQSLKTSYNMGFSIKNLTITRRPDGKLTVKSFVHFTDHSGRRDYSKQDTFKFYAVRAIPIKKQVTKKQKINPAQLKAKRLAEWYRAHPDERPRK